MRRPLNTPWKFGKNHMPLADSVNVRHGQVGLVRLLLTTMQALKRWGVLSSAAGSFDRPSVPTYLAFMFFVFEWRRPYARRLVAFQPLEGVSGRQPFRRPSSHDHQPA